MTVPGSNPAPVKTGTQYDTALPFLDARRTSWVSNKFDQVRLGAYDLYDDIYRNVTGTFKLVARGTENNPIYIPNGKTIIETCNRFLAVDFDFTITGGDGPGRDAAKKQFDAMFRRQKFFSKFVTQKRFGLIRGDALWHLVAYPDKPRDRRVVLYELDPRTYFPITNPDDVDDVIGCYIIKVISDPAQPGGPKIVRRQRYMYNKDGTVQSTLDYYRAEAWDDRIDPETLNPYHSEVGPLNRNPKRTPEPFDITLPKQIDTIPVYHIPNVRAPLNVFGVSELSGIERVIAAVNQGISDEELALALEGLGLYWTNSGPPTDDNGNPQNWVLGPGRVVEINENAEFKRVTGISSVDPSLNHLNWLSKMIRENTATADVAVGMVSNMTPVSGIALAFQMGPLLAKNAEKETEMLGEYDNMFNDLMLKWFPAYDILEPNPNMLVTPIVGDPMPKDRAAVIKEVGDLVTNEIITVIEAQKILEDQLGYDFKNSSLDDFKKQLEAMTKPDPFANRVNQELDNSGDSGSQQEDS